MAESHEFIDFGTDVTEVFDTCMKTGTIVTVDYGAETATVNINGTEYQDVPIFYHCDNSQTTEFGSFAFKPEDQVLVVTKWARDDSVAEERTIVGFASGPKSCCWESFAGSLRAKHDWEVGGTHIQFYTWGAFPDNIYQTVVGDCIIGGGETFSKNCLWATGGVPLDTETCHYTDENGKVRIAIDGSDAPPHSPTGDYYSFNQQMIRWSSSENDPWLTPEQKYMRIKFQYEAFNPHTQLELSACLWMNNRILLTHNGSLLGLNIVASDQGVEECPHRIKTAPEMLWFPGCAYGKMSGDVDTLVDIMDYGRNVDAPRGVIDLSAFDPIYSYYRNESCGDTFTQVQDWTWGGCDRLYFSFTVPHGGYINLDIDCIDFLTAEEVV